MPYVADKIEIPGRRKLRSNLVTWGFVSGFFGVGFFLNQNAGGMLVCAALAVGLFYIAAKIKIFREYQGSASVYR
ncbi:MAG: hypothetical protein HWE30_18090 [Methylocystaceae bacterium]|nr:hypothetical protein [Methylocystaceae bacterium]